MEGCDANPDGTPHELTIRRYERFAEGGAGLIWAEAVAVMKEGRANPRQLYICDENVDSFKKMVEDTKNITMKKFGFEPMIIMQATHSGRYSKPNGFPEPLIAYNNSIFEKDNPISKDRILSDDYLKRLEEQYGVAAIQAQKAGFDGIDIKCCHRYLLCELLSAYEREGEFGGSLENRSRLLINGVKNAKAATDNKFLVTTRMNIYDGFPYPYGFGVYRPGGTALNSTQVGSLRPAEHIAYNKDLRDVISYDEFYEIVKNDIILPEFTEEKNNAIVEDKNRFAKLMSEGAAYIRNPQKMQELYDKTSEYLLTFKDKINKISIDDVCDYFKFYDMLVTQNAVLKSMIFSADKCKSRGGSLVMDGEISVGNIKVETNSDYDDKVVYTEYNNGNSDSYALPVREIPKRDHWFESVWNEYIKYTEE